MLSVPRMEANPTEAGLAALTPRPKPGSQPPHDRGREEGALYDRGREERA